MDVDRSGWFKAKILDYGLTEADSGSVAVSFTALLTEWWDGQAWQPWEQYEMSAPGAVWVIKRDGTVNEKAVESLMKCCGWDGTLPSVVNKTWEPTAFQGEVKSEVYKDQKRYRIEWLAAVDAVPGKGSLGTVDEMKLKALETKYGAGLRAVASNFARNKPAAATSRPAPPPPATAGAGKGNGDEIPFAFIGWMTVLATAGSLLC